MAVDASPWGIGGVLIASGRPLAWFADDITQPDLDRFHAQLGDSAFTTLWEALAILVAFRLWRRPGHASATIAPRSDSLGALSAYSKFASRSPGLTVVLQELALDEAEFTTPVTFTHIPGLLTTCRMRCRA